LAPGPADSSAWRDLRVRVASAVVLAPLGLAALWWGSLAFAALMGLVTFGLLREIRDLSRRRGGQGLFIVVAAIIGLAIAGFVWLRADDAVGRLNVLFVVMVGWASDIGAYLAGRLLGGPRLAPRISPGKTWTGAMGGLACAVGVGFAAALLDPSWQSGSRDGLMVALGLGFVSQIGDLLESALKRYVGVKDSGHLIPGHGGLLDRLDGMILAVIVAAALSMMFGRGVVLWQ